MTRTHRTQRPDAVAIGWDQEEAGTSRRREISEIVYLHSTRNGTPHLSRYQSSTESWNEDDSDCVQKHNCSARKKTVNKMSGTTNLPLSFCASLSFFRIDWPNLVLVTRTIELDASRGKSKRTTQEWEMKVQDAAYFSARRHSDPWFRNRIRI
jgi:hypothetical protein